jgi:hypothetical protein
MDNNRIDSYSKQQPRNKFMVIINYEKRKFSSLHEKLKLFFQEKS